MAALHVTKADFKQEVLQSDKRVLVDFWADWCGPCKRLGPVVEQLAEEQREVKICKVDIEEAPELAQQFKVMQIPTLILFENGQEIKKTYGTKSKKELLDFIQSN